MRVAILVLLAALAGTPALAQSGVAPVVVDAVRVEPFAQTAPLLGRFVATREGAVASRIGGTLDDLLVQVGDRVERGQVLARLRRGPLLDARRFALARADSARAELAGVQAELAARQAELSRLERLRASAAFSAAALEDKVLQIGVVEAQIGAARATLAEAEAELVAAERNLIESEVRAPYPGVVLTRESAPGAYVGEGDTVVTLLDDGSLELEADVPGERAAALAPGDELRVRLAGSVEVLARVRAVLPAENPLTRTRAVRFALVRTPPDLVPARGATVTLDVPVGAAREVVTVAKDALVQRPDGWIVFVEEDGQAQPRRIEIGAAVGGRFEVTSGLDVGERVVVRGNERLRPSQRIAATEAGAS